MKRILFVLTLLMTALNTTFCSKQVQKENNPLLTKFDTPYGVPPFDKIEAKHYKPAFKFAMSLHNDEMATILANKEEPTFQNTILELDHSGVLLASEVISIAIFAVLLSTYASSDFSITPTIILSIKSEQKNLATGVLTRKAIRMEKPSFATSKMLCTNPFTVNFIIM